MASSENRTITEERIKEKTIVLEIGCHKWYIDTGTCPMTSLREHGGKRKLIRTHRFLYEQYHSTRLTDRKFILKRTCETQNCINPEHYILSDQKKTETKEETWERLLSNSTRVDDHIIWAASSKNVGFRGGTYIPYHVSYIIHKNNMAPIPKHNEDGEKLVIRHKCTAKGCMNPDHLEIGTMSENGYDDKLRDGTLLRGEKSHTAKITEQIASEIKLSLFKKGEAGYKTPTERANHFGVTSGMVRAIDNGYSWRHLPNKHGNISPDHREQQQKARDKARSRVWTSEEYASIIPMLKLQVEYTSGNKKDTSIPGDCWEFTGGRSPKNYGYKRYLGIQSYAHILACTSKNERRLLPNEVTRHLCGNHPCCNPDHLEFGTHYENMMDDLKHRNGRVLKKTDVLDIRDSEESYTSLAKRYNVTNQTIGSIKKRRTWKHI